MTDPNNRRCTTVDLGEGAYLTLPSEVLLDINVMRPLLLACGVPVADLPTDSGPWVEWMIDRLYYKEDPA